MYKELKLFTAHPEATLALANGTCDAQTQTVPNLAVVAKKQKGVFELVGPITDKTYMAWVTRPEDTDLRDYISSKILELIKQLSLPFPSNLAFFKALKAVASSLNSMITLSLSS